MDRYQLKQIEINGGSFQGTINTSPRRLVEVFGPPPTRFVQTEPGEELDQTGEYRFVDREGFCSPSYVYDWQATTLHSSGKIPHDEFWESDETVEFHVGSNGSADHFIRWLEEKLSL